VILAKQFAICEPYFSILCKKTAVVFAYLFHVAVVVTLSIHQ